MNPEHIHEIHATFQSNESGQSASYNHEYHDITEIPSLVLSEEVLLEVKEAPDESAVEEGGALPDVQPHATLVRLKGVRREVGRRYHIL